MKYEGELWSKWGSLQGIGFEFQVSGFRGLPVSSGGLRYNGFMVSYMLHNLMLSWPTDWAGVFGRPGELLVEVGFGGGEFLWDLAEKRPFSNLLGIEIALPSLRKAEKKLSKYPSVRLLHSEAVHALWLLCAPGTVQGLYLNFSDPWPKPGQQHRRLINERFIHLAATRLATGATLYIATDIADYAEGIAACLTDSPYFESLHPTPFVTEDLQRPITKYERLAQENGRICHYFHWQRTAIAAPNIFQIPQEFPMPHVVLRTPLSLPQVEAEFRPFQAEVAKTHVRFVEIFYSSHKNKLLVEIYVAEEPLVQRLALYIEPRPGGNIQIGLHDIGFPRPTPGIAFAIQQLGNWVNKLHPQTELVYTNIVVPQASS